MDQILPDMPLSYWDIENFPLIIEQAEIIEDLMTQLYSAENLAQQGELSLMLKTPYFALTSDSEVMLMLELMEKDQNLWVKDYVEITLQGFGAGSIEPALTVELLETYKDLWTEDYVESVFQEFVAADYIEPVITVELLETYKDLWTEDYVESVFREISSSK